MSKVMNSVEMDGDVNSGLEDDNEQQESNDYNCLFQQFHSEFNNLLTEVHAECCVIQESNDLQTDLNSLQSQIESEKIELGTKLKEAHLFFRNIR